MTDRAKFEQMLEYLINEDQEKAKEIFHSIVVEKSREIYETLLSEDFDDLEEVKDEDNKDPEDEMEENFAFDEADDDMGPEMSMDDEEDSMDASDDFMGDIEAGDESGDDMDDQEQTDRILDLESALDDLKAEFEKLMSDDDEMDMGDEDDMGMDDEEGMDMDMDMDDEKDKMETYDDSFMREYVEKVSSGHGAERKGAPEQSDKGAKSPVAKPNRMGGSSANIARGGVESEGASTKGGLANPATKEENFGNVNTPGSKSATKMSSVSKGHGAEKRGAGEVGGVNTKSIIGR